MSPVPSPTNAPKLNTQEMAIVEGQVSGNNNGDPRALCPQLQEANVENMHL